MVRGNTTEVAMEERARMPMGPDWIADVIAVAVDAMVTLFNDVLVLLLLLVLLVSMGEMSPPRMWMFWIVLNERVLLLLFSFKIVFLVVVGFTKADAISKEFAKRNRKMI